jgi:hypothetical protein
MNKEVSSAIKITGTILYFCYMVALMSFTYSDWKLINEDNLTLNIYLLILHIIGLFLTSYLLVKLYNKIKRGEQR